jgi:hypothetical protein
MSNWRDGKLGQPVNRLEPHSGVTHAVTIPGTTYRAFFDEFYMLPQNGKPARIDALLKALARTTVKGVGKRRVKAQPLLQTIEEFQALTTAKAA